MPDDLIREAFYAGARAFMSHDKIVRPHQEAALPEVFDGWLDSRAAAAPAVQAEAPVALRSWHCPECGEKGKSDPRQVPLYCFVCYTKPDAGKWVECIWHEGADESP
jgi:hypothetical protein